MKVLPALGVLAASVAAAAVTADYVARRHLPVPTSRVDATVEGEDTALEAEAAAEAEQEQD